MYPERKIAYLQQENRYLQEQLADSRRANRNGLAVAFLLFFIMIMGGGALFLWQMPREDEGHYVKVVAAQHRRIHELEKALKKIPKCKRGYSRPRVRKIYIPTGACVLDEQVKH